MKLTSYRELLKVLLDGLSKRVKSLITISCLHTAFYEPLVLFVTFRVSDTNFKGTQI